MKHTSLPTGACAVLASMLLAAPALAQGSAKDVVIDRIAATAASPPQASAATDAMAVSVLVEGADGTLAPRSLNSLFATGERFRVRLLATRQGRVALYNTNPKGEFNPNPVWQGEVKLGQETITPRLRLDGSRGVDQLHVVLEPEQAPPEGPVSWITRWLSQDGQGGGTASKDIRLDSESTPSTTYLVNRGSQGLITTFRIVHR